MTNQLQTFLPYYNVRQLDVPHRVSGNIYMSKPLVGSMAEYVSNEDE